MHANAFSYDAARDGRKISLLQSSLIIFWIVAAVFPPEHFTFQRHIERSPGSLDDVLQININNLHSVVLIGFKR